MGLIQKKWQKVTDSPELFFTLQQSLNSENIWKCQFFVFIFVHEGIKPQTSLHTHGQKFAYHIKGAQYFDIFCKSNFSGQFLWFPVNKVHSVQKIQHYQKRCQPGPCVYSYQWFNLLLYFLCARLHKIFADLEQQG